MPYVPALFQKVRFPYICNPPDGFFFTMNCNDLFYNKLSFLSHGYLHILLYIFSYTFIYFTKKKSLHRYGDFSIKKLLFLFIIFSVLLSSAIRPVPAGSVTLLPRIQTSSSHAGSRQIIQPSQPVTHRYIRLS